MDGNVNISIDMPPLKRVDILEENGAERFPQDLGYDEKRVNLIQRIDFAWALEREDLSKKQKKSGSTTATTTSKDSPWPWQSMVENLQLAHQELYVIIDLINTAKTKVVVNDDCINVEGEGAPNVAGLLKGKYENICFLNRFDCDLEDLPGIILQQVASQIIRWLHEEALTVGIKVNRDFLCLSFELEQGETPSLVAHVDVEDPRGISWWLVMSDGLTEDYKLNADISEYENRRFLGYLSLDVFYSTLLDLVRLCGGGGSH